MTDFNSLDNNTVEQKGIDIEIWEPDLLVVSVPKNSTNATTFVQIHLWITNNTPKIFPFIDKYLMPELFTVDGKEIHHQKTSDRPIATNYYKGIAITPKNTTTRAIVRSFMAKLFWQNNYLQLQTSLFYATTTIIAPEKIYLFQPLRLGTYQLRFIYLSPGHNLLLKDSPTAEIIRVEESERSLFASPAIILRFIEPVPHHNNRVEVDGMCFETLVPEQSLRVPLTASSAKIPVQIGMKIANNTSTPFRFILFDTLIPQLIGENGMIPRLDCGGSLGFVIPQESDLQLVKPGESITLFLKASLTRQANNLLSLIVSGGGRSCWRFNDLAFGTYQIHLTYRSLTEKLEFLCEDLWMGMVNTPFVEFRLIPP